MKEFAELITAIGMFAWPIFAAVALYFLYPLTKDFISRDKVKFKIGQLELSAEQATESISNQLKDLQNKVLEIERAIPKLEQMPERPKPSASPAKRRILWVDDHPANNAIQIDKLQIEGWRVDLATTTDDAIKAFTNQEYDLIITDIGRKEDGVRQSDAGIQLAKEIRKLNTHTPIIAFTTHQALSRFQTSAQKAGINHLTNSTVELYRYIDAALGEK